MTRAFAACLLVVATTCTPVPLGEGTRRRAMRELTEQVVLPTFDDVAAKAAALTGAIDALAAAPAAATLDAAQDAWRAARAPWKECDAFAFGPAMDERFTATIDQFPVDFDKLEMEIAGTAALTEPYVESIGANRKGFHAIEYLVFRGDDDAAVLASLTTEPGAVRRREFAVALAHNLERKVGELRRAWAVDGGAYAVSVASPGSSNTTYPTIKAVVDAFVNESLFLSEIVADTRLGKPLGNATGGTPQPQLEESGPSDNSLADMTSSLRGIRNIYTGARGGIDGDGISALVAAQSFATDREVLDLLDAAIAAIAAIPRPFKTAIVDHRTEVQAAYDAVKELKRLFGTEVIAVLGATIKFNDNDGD